MGQGAGGMTARLPLLALVFVAIFTGTMAGTVIVDLLLGGWCR
jgi:hypothetical protein